MLREDGTETEVGEIGELTTRGSHIMCGYRGDPEETGLVLGAAGFRTGDPKDATRTDISTLPDGNGR